MKNFTKAREVITRNESAVVLFTRGLHFTYDSSGNGESGIWVLNPKKLENVDKVIIYLRDEDKKVNKLYIANYSGYRKSDLPRRFYINFSQIQETGRTGANWMDFAESGQNPVAYIINH
jgi:hypothetical protein